MENKRNVLNIGIEIQKMAANTIFMFIHKGSFCRLATSAKLLQSRAVINSCSKSHERSVFSSPHMPPNPTVKYKKERARKVMIQHYEKIEEKPDKYRVGLPTYMYTKSKEIGITTVGDIINPHIPLESDVKYSLTKKEKVDAARKDTLNRIAKFRFLRHIKKYDPTFNQKEFLAQAHHIYIQAHKCIERLRENDEELMDYVTQHVYGQMTKGMMDKTLQWEFVESVEQPKIVTAAGGAVISKDNAFGQLTVRFHTLQKLAIYNRFGRLTYGDCEKPRYMLEYVVFEKHISDTEGKWRIAGKVTPEWKSKGFTFLHTWKEDRESSPEEEPEPYVIHRFNPEYPDEMTTGEETSDEQTNIVPETNVSESKENTNPL